MISVAVCDDDSVMLDLLSASISESFARGGEDVEIRQYDTGSSLLNAFKSERFNVVFLDIKMPDVDGFSAAKEIRRQSGNVFIIFITTESALVYDSFEFQPFNFIPKNSDNFRTKLESVVKAILSRIKGSKPVTLKLPYSEELTFKTCELVCIKSSGNYTEYFFSGKEPVRVRQKLDSALENIGSELFLRPHKSFAVNMEHIRKISFPRLMILLDDGSEIPISKPNKASVEEQYSRFLRNSGGAR